MITMMIGQRNVFLTNVDNDDDDDHDDHDDDDDDDDVDDDDDYNENDDDRSKQRISTECCCELRVTGRLWSGRNDISHCFSPHIR